jgi:hypothetical protein
MSLCKECASPGKKKTMWLVSFVVLFFSLVTYWQWRVPSVEPALYASVVVSANMQQRRVEYKVLLLFLQGSQAIFS